MKRYQKQTIISYFLLSRIQHMLKFRVFELRQTLLIRILLFIEMSKKIIFLKKKNSFHNSLRKVSK